MKRPRPEPRAVLIIPVVIVAAWALPAWGYDAISYWLPDPIGRYGAAMVDLEGAGAFRYSPVMALPVLAFHLIPWPLFLVAWTGLLIAAVVWLATPRWALLAFVLPPVALAVALGNVTVLTTVCIVLGVRYPVAWLVPLLTKITPGVGLLWWAVRDWRRLIPVAFVGAGLVGLSELILPGSWSAWLTALRAQAGLADPWAWPMMLSGAALTVYAARTDRAWLLPFCVLLAGRGIGWSSLVVLLALPRLAERQVLPRRRTGERDDVQRVQGHDRVDPRLVQGERRVGGVLGVVEVDVVS